MRYIALLIVAVAGLLAPPLRPAVGQDVQRIAAVVNDEIVSVFDLVSRTRVVLASTSVPDTPEARRQITAQVLRTLIDERIQLQEAKRLNITVSDADVAQALQQVERQNNMPPGGLDTYLKQNNLRRETLEAQIRAAISWQRVVTRRFRSSLQVGEDEIEDALQRFRSSQGVPESLVAEIFLPVDSPEQDDEVKQSANRLLEQIRSGAPFTAVARQFSQSASAAAGGDVGWVQPGQYGDEIEGVLRRLNPGQLAGPVRAVGGYYLLLVRERRVIGGGGADARLSLAQVVLPLAPTPSEADLAAQSARAERLRQQAKSCTDLGRVTQEEKLAAPTEMKDLKLTDLAPNLRPLVAGLRVGEMTQPLRVNPGLVMLMVCARQETANANLPKREDIAESLTRQRLDLLARRYLRDLRRAAFVDVRV